MKKIPLTQGKVALVDDEDFERLMQHNWYFDKRHKRDGNYKGYARGRTQKGQRTMTKMHRFILGITDPKVFVDHRDGNGLNNQKSNFRVTTNEHNSKNRQKRKKTAMKYKGVGVRVKGSVREFFARIHVGDKIVTKHGFRSQKQAALAYNELAKQHHGEFAGLNEVRV